MISYSGRHAELYDLIYANKDYRAEAEFVHELLEQYRTGDTSKVLELACGTGSHALHLQDLGHRVTASDYSVDMLRVARSKAHGAGSGVQFIQQDMRRLDGTLRNFDAVVCLFDSIGYVQTNAALTEVMAGVRDALRIDGLFVFEFWHAAAMLRGFDPVRVRRYSIANGELLRITETHLDAASQLATVQYEIVELNRDGTYYRFHEVQINRFFQLQEMSQFLASAGLQLVAAYSGFSDEQAIDATTWHIVAVAKKN